MSNIRIDSSFSLEFLGSYVIKSVEMESGSELSGEAIMRVLIDGEEYKMKVPMKEGKKEGIGLLLRKDGTLYMKLMFVNNECEGEVIKTNVYGNTLLKGRVSKGKEVGIWIEYDDDGNEIWRGFYRNGKRYVTLNKQSGMEGFFKEKNEKGELLSVSEYDDNWIKNGRCFEYEDERVVRECEYKNGRMIGVLREWKGEVMTEYDENGMKVYEGEFEREIVKGEFEREIVKGFVREGKGKEYGSDGKSILYNGGWKNGLREGYGSEFKGYFAVYIGEWKNGLRDGDGRELNEKGEVVRSGRWVKGKYGIQRFEDGYGSDLRAFDVGCLKGIERLEIGNGCFTDVPQFVIDGLNVLKSVKIGKESFIIDNSRWGSKCVIMNCDHLTEIHIGRDSFEYNHSFELKNLPSLISIQIDSCAFSNCRSIVFESMND